MYDCVLFDLDGTLTDSASGIMRSMNYALESMGYALLPADKQRLYVGPTLLDSFINLHGMTEEQALKGVEIFRERYSKIGWQENRVYEGIPCMLKSLKAQGVYLGVATAKPVKFAERVLEYYGLDRYMDAIVAAPMDESGMPKAELIRRALPAKARSSVMVGDRVYDIDGARQAGIGAIGALYGYGSRAELSGADAVCGSVDELSQALGVEKCAAGVFISMEGIDGCGKSTQWQMLRDWLELCGWRVKATREPGGTPAGEAIRELLLNKADLDIGPECEALLFAASRAQHTRAVIRPALEKGEVVLSDRYLDSSLAYQGMGRGIGMDEVMQMNLAAVNGVMPDMTFFFDLDTERARLRRRGEDDRIEREKAEFHRRVRTGFIKLCAAEPARIKRLDAELSPEALFDIVRQSAMERLARI